MTPCLSCGRGYCNECGIHDCCNKDTPSSQSTAVALFTDIEPKKQGRPPKADEDLLDVRSTGRKRANKTAPITDNMPCEWRMLKNCGGGKFPVVGCANGIAKHVHHGDKDKLNNIPENLHRICTSCHSRWHNANDKDFQPSPHKPEPVTMEEFIKLHTEIKNA